MYSQGCLGPAHLATGWEGAGKLQALEMGLDVVVDPGLDLGAGGEAARHTPVTLRQLLRQLLGELLRVLGAAHPHLLGVPLTHS